MEDGDSITVVMTVGQAKKFFGSEIVEKKKEKVVEKVYDDNLPREMQNWK